MAKEKQTWERPADLITVDDITQAIVTQEERQN